MAAANKKASRHAAEGLVGLAKGDAVAAVVEVRRRQGCAWAHAPWLANLDQRHMRSPILAPRACPPAVLPACLQINSETDFVARNEQFHSLVGSAAAAALGVTSLRPGSSSELEGEALKAAKLADGSRCVLGRVVCTQMAGAAAGCGHRARVCLSCRPVPALR
jgi:hypothetical protein